MKCIVNWIPLRIRVRSRNTQPHLKMIPFSQLDHEKLLKLQSMLGERLLRVCVCVCVCVCVEIQPHVHMFCVYSLRR